MAEHAIVLFDPTVDLLETAEEQALRLEAERLQAEAKAEKLRIEGPNPHKSLREMLGLKSKEELERAKKEVPKVPVVIDPRLSKVLRPHQIEGVKVRRCEQPCSGLSLEGESRTLTHRPSPPSASLRRQFLYRCTTGLLASDAFGCIVADEMGLGTRAPALVPLALRDPS
jgi:DNA repair and recombination RAD54-like protein